MVKRNRYHDSEKTARRTETFNFDTLTTLRESIEPEIQKIIQTTAPTQTNTPTQTKQTLTTSTELIPTQIITAADPKTNTINYSTQKYDPKTKSWSDVVNRIKKLDTPPEFGPVRTCMICGMDGRSRRFIDGSWMCPICITEHTITCIECGIVTLKSKAKFISGQKQYVCNSCHEKESSNYTLCPGCDLAFHNELITSRGFCITCMREFATTIGNIIYKKAIQNKSTMVECPFCGTFNEPSNPTLCIRCKKPFNVHLEKVYYAV